MPQASGVQMRDVLRRRDARAGTIVRGVATMGILLAISGAASQPAAAATRFPWPGLPPTVAPLATRAPGAEHAMAAVSPSTAGTTVDVGQLPTGVAATNSTAYVADAQSNALSVVDLASSPASVTATIPVGTFPVSVALSPDDSTAYVANFRSATLSIVNLSTDAVRTVGNVGSDPDGVIQIGASVYVAGLTSGTITVVDPATAAVTGTITLPGNRPAPSGLGASPDGSTLYYDDARNATTGVIDLADDPPAALGSVGVGTYPASLAITGTTAYVANATKGGATPGTVSVLDLSNPVDPAVTTTIPVGSHPYGVAAVPTLGEVLASNSGDGTVSVIDTASRTVLGTADVGTTPDAIAVTPDQRTAIVSDEGDDAVTVLPVDTLARLWDQTSGATAEATNSQNYEPAYATYDDQAADDFPVTANAFATGWRITGVVADGTYGDFTPAGPAASFNVDIYADTGSHLPGALVFSEADIPQLAEDSTGDVTLPLSPPVLLPPGRYWLSVQANQAFSVDGAWFWDDRAPLSLSPAVWEQPADASRLRCPAWSARDQCIPLSGPANPDQAFALLGGESAAVPASRPARVVQPSAGVTPPLSSVVVRRPAGAGRPAAGVPTTGRRRRHGVRSPRKGVRGSS